MDQVLRVYYENGKIRVFARATYLMLQSEDRHKIGTYVAEWTKKTSVVQHDVGTD